MSLTAKGRKIMRAMKKHYGPSRGERVFYASATKGWIRGVWSGERRARSRARRST